MDDVEKEPAVAFLKRIGGDPAADRGSGWRAIGEMEATVVFGALDDVVFYESVR
jgi:hypothetical protein